MELEGKVENASDSINNNNNNNGTVNTEAEKQEFTYDTEKYGLLQEGTAKILYSKGNEVFYNPAQEVNRDLSIMMIKLYSQELAKERQQREESRLKKQQDMEGKKRKPKANEEESSWDHAKPEDGIKILEALSATGLRSIRYIKEIPGVKSIIVNDIDSNAVAAIRRNLEFNGVDTNVAIPNHADATTCMYEHRDISKRFDVVDLDPYGTAANFLDGAVQSVAEGGLLCVTCTDMAVLCGNHSEACWAKYGSMPLHSRYNHEMALRIVLACIESHANRYKRYIVPVLTMYIDFYVRIFVRVYTSPNEVKKSPTKLSTVFQCIGCDTFHLNPLAKMIETSGGGLKFSPSLLNLESSNCTDCGRSLRMGGPIWTKPIHDKAYVNKLLEHIEQNSELYNQSKKLHGLLTAVEEELVDQPLYYTLALSNTLHLTALPMDKIKSAILHAGFRVSGSHTNPGAIKTDAPSSVIWDIMRGWEKLHPLAEKRKAESTTSPYAVILGKEAKIQANFELHPNLNKPRAARFIPNKPFWGPGTRAGRPQKGKKTQVPRKKRPFQKDELKNGTKDVDNKVEENVDLIMADDAEGESKKVKVADK